MTDIEKLISIARKDIGYTEGKNNDNKFGKSLGMNNVFWCVLVQTYWIRQLGFGDYFYGGKVAASCSATKNYYAPYGMIVYNNYRPGDLIIFDFAGNNVLTDHMGLCTAYNGSYITTIDGNTSAGSGSQSNGDCVAEKRRQINSYTKIHCGIRLFDDNGMFIKDINSVKQSAITETKTTKETVGYKITKLDSSLYIAEIPVEQFSIEMNDSRKNTATSEPGYANGGFFGNYKDSASGTIFTLPIGHLIADCTASFAPTKAACSKCGKFNGSKFTFDCGKYSYANHYYGKNLSTLLVGNTASIQRCTTLPDGYKYAISGVPVMRSGNDVKYKVDVVGEGYGSDSLYGTWHTLIGLKDDKTKIYVIAMKTTTSNLVYSAEAYKKLQPLGFKDVIKLDGGGSFIFSAGNTKVRTTENRRINNIINFGKPSTIITTNTTTAQTKYLNPYTAPSVAVRYGSTGNNVKWLQTALNYLGFSCGAVDGSFGNGTLAAVKKFQETYNLDVDGSCGNITRKKILSLV